jgi:hypothetical protein
MCLLCTTVLLLIFLNFFGVRGAEEIEKAIAVLNDLPEADNIVIDDYPLESVRVNHRAQALGIRRLKNTGHYKY